MSKKKLSAIGTFIWWLGALFLACVGGAIIMILLGVLFTYSSGTNHFYIFPVWVQLIIDTLVGCVAYGIWHEVSNGRGKDL